MVISEPALVVKIIKWAKRNEVALITWDNSRAFSGGEYFTILLHTLHESFKISRDRQQWQE